MWANWDFTVLATLVWLLILPVALIHQWLHNRSRRK